MASGQKHSSWGTEVKGMQGNLLYQIVLFNWHAYSKKDYFLNLRTVILLMISFSLKMLRYRGQSVLQELGIRSDWLGELRLSRQMPVIE